MIVLVIGNFRSASTWLYNCARLLLPQDGLYCGPLKESMRIFLEASRAPNAVLKTHTYMEQAARKADVILTCHRHPYGMYESAGIVREGKWNHGREYWIRYSIEQYLNHVRREADLDLEYETIVKDQLKAISLVAHHIVGHGVVDVPAIKKQLDNLPRPESGTKHHPVTLLHPGHRTHGRFPLNDEEKAKVRGMWFYYMEQCGYTKEGGRVERASSTGS